ASALCKVQGLAFGRAPPPGSRKESRINPAAVAGPPPLLALPLIAAPAAAQQPAKPAAPSQAKPSAPADKQKFTSVGDLQQAFSDERDKAEKESQEKELAAIKTYMKGTITDKEDALMAAQSLATQLEQWNDAKTFGEDFAKEFAKSDKLFNVQLATAGALGHIDGKSADAKKLYTELADKAGDDKQKVIGALIPLVGLQADDGDIDGAKATLDRMAKEGKGLGGLDTMITQRRA